MKQLVFENKNYALRCERQQSLSPVPHFHRNIELVYTIKGDSYATADRKTQNLSTGDIFISFPNQIHYYNTVEKGDYIVVILSPDIIFGVKDILFDNIPKNNVVNLSHIPDFQNLVLKTMNNNEEFEITMKAGIINQIMATALPLFTLKPRIKTNNTTLQEVLNFCSANFANDITLDAIADALNISKFHISHLLNNKLGMSLNTYINSLRINRACDMLEDTENKISHISEEVGFGSIRSFNRAFKETMNKTPVEYRNQFKTLS